MQSITEQNDYMTGITLTAQYVLNALNVTQRQQYIGQRDLSISRSMTVVVQSVARKYPRQDPVELRVRNCTNGLFYCQ